MNLIIWLIVGGILGWLASIVMKRDAQQGVLLNVVVGIVGAFLGGAPRPAPARRALKFHYFFNSCLRFSGVRWRRFGLQNRACR